MNSWPRGFFKKPVVASGCSGGKAKEDDWRLSAPCGPASGKNAFAISRGETSLGVFLALLSRVRVLVANDSGALHVAQALGVPSVALFGSTSLVWTGPLGKKCAVVKHDVPCSPCFRRTCPIDTVCLKSVAVEEVVLELKRLLEKA